MRKVKMEDNSDKLKQVERCNYLETIKDREN